VTASPERSLRAAVITVSSSRAHAGGADESGDALERLVAALDGEVAGREVVADDRDALERLLRRWSDGERCDLILTTGGTGFTADDVTPEATAAVIDRPVPGIAEAMRSASAPHTRHWMLSRATAGIRGRTLIVNFPGNPRAIAETAAAIAGALPHAVALLRREPATLSEPTLLHPDEALAIVLEQIVPLRSEHVPLGSGLGRVTVADVVSEMPVPPCGRSRVASTRSSVVLPAPFDPNTPSV